MGGVVVPSVSFFSGYLDSPEAALGTTRRRDDKDAKEERGLSRTADTARF